MKSVQRTRAKYYQDFDIYDPKLSVVFCNTKKGVDELVADLKEEDISQKGFTAI